MSMISDPNNFSDVIIQSSFDAIISKSLDGVMTSWDPDAEKLYGYTAIEAIGQPISIITPLHKKSELSDIMEKIKRGEQIVHFETTHQHKNGSLIDVSVTMSPIKDANKNVIGFSTIVHDISEHQYFEEQFRQTLDALSDAAIVVDTTGKIIFANAQINRIFGYAKEDLLEKSMEMLIPEPYRSRHLTHQQQYFLQPRERPMGSRGMELYGLHKNGREIPLEISLSPLKTKNSLLTLAIICDISEKKRNENALKEKTKKLEYINQALEEFAYVTSHDLKEPLKVNRILILEDNPEEQALYKRYLSSSFGPDLEIIVAEKGEEALTYLFKNTVDCILLDFELPDMTGLDVVSKLAAINAAYPTIMATGHGDEKIAVKALKMGVYDYIVKEDLDPQLLRNTILYAIEKSALEKKSKENATKMQHVAYHDSLTLIPNRRYFELAFVKMLAAAKRYHTPVTLMMLDLDGFKGVNDTFGHAVGDELLKQATQRLQSTLRDEDLLARLGGDEFVILIRDIQQTEDVRMVAQKLINALKEPIHLNGNSVSITPSIGIVTYPHSGETIPDLLRNADKIMYQAKNKGGNCFEMDIAPPT